MKKFPVYLNKRQRAVYRRCPEYIDVSLLDNAHALKIHGHDLEHLAERGGLTPAEIISNVRSLDCKKIKGLSIYKAVQLLVQIAASSK